MSDFISAKVEDSTLYLCLSGRIDSQNAPEAEKLIVELRSANPAESTVIDAENLEYISSAGLRVILRLRKDVPSLKIINVCPEVYEIFDMTGFTEMIKVEKAYRRISVEGCEIIGRGSNGEVYRLDPDTIIKVYLNPDSLPDIQRERELARKAFVLGIPTAIPYDVVKVGDGYGSVFELLNAKSLTKILVSEPEKMDEVCDVYVDLLKKIHSTEVQPGDMPDMKEVVLGWVNDIKDYIDADKWQKLLALVEAVPYNLHMIHGDYHTKNVMVQNGEVLLIDMDTLCHGDPVFEFASVFNAYIGFYGGLPPIQGPSFIGISYGQGVDIWKKTLKLYFGTDDAEYLKSVEEKASLIGYTRLLRRTMRRCNTEDPVVKEAVSFYRKTIEELADRLTTLQF